MCCTAYYYKALHCTAPHYTALHYTSVHCVVLCHVPHAVQYLLLILHLSCNVTQRVQQSNHSTGTVTVGADSGAAAAVAAVGSGTCGTGNTTAVV